MNNDDENQGKALNTNDRVYQEIDQPDQTSESPIEDNTEQEQTVEEPEVEEVEDSNEEEIDDTDEEQSQTQSSGKRDRTVAGRINRLNQRIKTLEKDGVEDDSGVEDQFGFNPPQFPPIQPGQEITPQQYQQHIAAQANALVDLRFRQFQNGQRIKNEITEAVSEHPELNPKVKDSFDPDLSDSVTEAVKAFVKANPTGNVKAYINKLVKPYRRSIEKAVGKQTEVVAKQASQTSLRPTTAKPPEKKFEDLSLAEMEARLGKVY